MKVVLDIEDDKTIEYLKILKELSFVKDVSLIDFKSSESLVDDLSHNMFASEAILSIDWLKKEENEVWANL
ncbi:MAG TPA: hypothetical protein PKD51_02775 [Saprospiraceae bacterium]|nr:hypothetical protein [Saprospiraceae bacterium]